MSCAKSTQRKQPVVYPRRRWIPIHPRLHPAPISIRIPALRSRPARPGAAPPGMRGQGPPAPGADGAAPRALTAAAAEALPQELPAGEVLQPEAAGDPLAHRALARAGGAEHHGPQQLGGHGRLPAPERCGAGHASAAPAALPPHRPDTSAGRGDPAAAPPAPPAPSGRGTLGFVVPEPPAHPPARRGPRGSAHPGPARPGSVHPGSVHPGWVHPCPVHPGSVQPRSPEPPCPWKRLPGHVPHARHGRARCEPGEPTGDRDHRCCSLRYSPGVPRLPRAGKRG